MDRKKFFAELTRRNVYKIAMKDWEIIADTTAEARYWRLLVDRETAPRSQCGSGAVAFACSRLLQGLRYMCQY